MELVVDGFEILVGVAPLLAAPALVLVETALQIGQDALEFLLQGVLASVLLERERDLLAARAFQDELALFGGQLVPRLGKVDVEGCRGCIQHLLKKGAVAPLPRIDGALAQGKVGRYDDELGVERHRRADAIAGGASASGIVERKQAGSELGNADATVRASEPLRQQKVVAFERRYFHQAAAQLGGKLDGFG